MVGWCVIGKGKHWAWLGVVVAACSIGKPPDDGTAGESGATEKETASNQPSPANSSAGGSSAAADVPVPVAPPVSSTESPRPQGDCVEGATRTCGPASVAGSCRLGKSTCQQGTWSECEGAVLPAARDCSSALDNDCDGRPDNSVDDTCRCVGETREPCGTHPGFDGHGPCLAGVRSCIVSADKLSSDWSECSGSAGPGPQDSCSLRGDDSDCDGTPNSGCTCVEGDVIDCGPPASLGICVIGKSTCRGNKLGACVGAVTARPRDCRSHLDNDCDGNADDDVDEFCTCTVGDTRACGEHEGLDGNGICTAGEQTCVTANNNGTSAFGSCTGSVGPAARDCRSTEDNDCNAEADSSESSCGCTIGEVLACSTHPSDGIGNCHAGTQVCVAGSNGASNRLGPCLDSVGPKAADACTPGDDANCNGRPNEGCPVAP
jgi:hypothetical protein